MNKEGNQRGSQEQENKEKEEINQGWLFMAAIAGKWPPVMRKIIKGCGDSAREQIWNHRSLRNAKC